LLDVQLGGTALLARRIGTLQAARAFTQGRALAQGRVFDVIKVVRERPTVLVE
jgi:hypothetical protein